MTVSAAAVAADAGDGWQASLSLVFGARQGRSYVRQRRHIGPLLIQRPFYPEGAVCHVYLLHPPAGVVGGDSLCLEAEAEADSHALMTTPSAGKFYSNPQRVAHVAQRLRVAPGAALEWLPQETILFEGARAELDTRVELASDARYFGWEIVCLGRPAAGTGFGEGHWRQRLEVVVEGHPILVERLALDPGDPLLDAIWGLQGQVVSATLVCAAPIPCTLDALYDAGLGEPATGRGGVTRVERLLVARYLGAEAGHARAWFEALWAWLRPRVFGRPACPPRIWRT
ncbi:urease accessory protein UreD [Acidihalobacter prosperus]|uniref:Urease accessory protein UreD n=1 Tax=Acidihalobacter prosperus TaxID=160660 RepID=A0A1A6C404_9GAMM|nr:urease accessory protein UreD [Acidihalobacter prosperus]OBS09297.1 Urease accessory protein UreD [Acidihalobacter prosperus]